MDEETKTPLELFTAFVHSFGKCGPKGDGDDAWQRLLEYAQRLGRDYEKVVEEYYVP